MTKFFSRKRRSTTRRYRPRPVVAVAAVGGPAAPAAAGLATGAPAPAVDTLLLPLLLLTQPFYFSSVSSVWVLCSIELFTRFFF